MVLIEPDRTAIARKEEFAKKKKLTAAPTVVLTATRLIARAKEVIGEVVDGEKLERC